MNLWSGIGSRPNIKWLKVYSYVSGVTDYRFVTEFDYYAKIEPKLNHKGLSEAYCDKNFYHNILPASILPHIVIRNVDGIFYDNNYKVLDIQSIYSKLSVKDKVIIKKALDTGGGRNIELFQQNNSTLLNSAGDMLTINYLENTYKKDYLIQEYIEQHHFFSQFNPSSLNTVRILTYRSVKSNDVIPLHAVLRIGKPGSIVDNQASGGVAVGINNKGVLNPFAVNKFGEKLVEFNCINFSTVYVVPMFDKMIELAKDVAYKYHYHRLLGLDLCLDQYGEIKLIEVNVRNNEINFYQMSNGALFKNYTHEVIEYCKNKRATFSADFEI